MPGYFAKVTEHKEKHTCSPPNPSIGSLSRHPKFSIGTIWICDCGQGWKLWNLKEVYYVGNYLAYWRKYPRWYDKI